MAKGFIRKLDELGRVTIPIEIRRATGIEVLEPVDLYAENRVLHLVKGKGRKLDQLGRYTIPKEIRRSNKWGERQALDVYIENDEICMRKAGEECSICGADSHLIKVDDGALCLVCLRKASLVLKESSL